MKEYNIEIEEILQKVVKLEAEDVEEALNIVKEKYTNEDIVLDANDFVECNIRVLE